MKYVVGVLVALIVYGCTNKVNIKEEEGEEKVGNVLKMTDGQLASFELSVVEIVEKTMEQTIKLNGKIEVPPQGLLSVSSVYGGQVKSIGLLPGMSFKKGDVIVELEDNQFIQLQQDYLTVTAQLENAKAEYFRQQDLNQSKASSDKVYLQAKADYETLQITQRSLAQKLRLIHIKPEHLNMDNIKQSIAIYAPFDGFVAQVFVNAGRYVAPSEVMVELIDPRNMQLNVKLFEKDWAKVKVGQKLWAYTNIRPEDRMKGEVMLIGKNISEDRTVDVRVRLEAAPDKLMPGMYMNAEVVIPEQQAMALPEECVVDFEGGKYVFEIVDKNTFKMLAVECGEVGNGWVPIVNSDLLRNKNVVEKGAYTLLMALKNEGED